MGTIIVRQGERKLLPVDEKGYRYIFKCRQGQGYLRRMSEARRVEIKPEALASVQGGEVATVSALSDMVVENVRIPEPETENG